MNTRILICIASVLLIACNNSGSQQMVDLTPANPSTSPVPQTTDSNASTTNLPVKNSEGAALNPKHGAPGHRCDIPEGAPLNSPPNPVTTTIPANNTVPVTAPTTPPADKNVKLNPEHGQPGHDCSIPVGQPLKS